MDGVTIEMDAAVMDDQGRLGAVAGLRRVRHPVQVAAKARCARAMAASLRRIKARLYQAPNGSMAQASSFHSSARVQSSSPMTVSEMVER